MGHFSHAVDMTLAAHPANKLSRVVIGAAIEVHAALGPGLLESTYQRCMRRELELRGIGYAAEVELPITYGGERLDCGYRIDLIVARCLIIEIKSVEKLMPIHEAQLLTYLRLARMSAGLLINFNVRILKLGLRRLNLRQSSVSSPLPVNPMD